MMASFDNKKELKFVITLWKNAPPGVISSNVAGSTQSSVSLGSTVSGAGPAPQLTFQGFRATVDIDKAGGMMMGTLRAQIYGVTQNDMNACATFPYQPGNLASGVRMNTVQVFAIDGNQETLIFTGNIVNAWGNYQSPPDAFLFIQAQSTAVGLLTPSTPTSFSGGVSVAEIMAQLAQQMDLGFVNNGVTAQIKNPYLAGSPIDQVRALAKAAGIWWQIDNNVLTITPPYQPVGITSKVLGSTATSVSLGSTVSGSAAASRQVPLISPETGLVGYPTFDGFGVNIRSVFNPAIRWFGAFDVQSTLPQVNDLQPGSPGTPSYLGTWIATSIAYELDSEKPGGRWFMQIRGTRTGIALSAPSRD